MRSRHEKSYIKCGVWHFGGRKRQKEGFLPILRTIPKTLLVSAAGDWVVKF